MLESATTKRRRRDLSALDVARPEPDAVSNLGTDYRRILLISAGHFSNDLYGNLITALMPYLVIQGKISATLAGFILLVYLLGSSVLQPIFGHMSDLHGRRIFAVVGPIWVGGAAAFVGWAGNAGLLFLLAGTAGIGTAAFHPQAASMVDRISPINKGWAMSLFSMGGNVGFALAPVAAAGIATVGLHWSPLILVPGVMLTALLARYAPQVGGSTQGPRTDVSLRATARSVWKPLSLIVGVIATRSAVQYALIIFLPLFYHSKGFPPQLGSYYAFVLSLAGALGGLAGGHLSDLYGRKIVVVSSLLLSCPLLVLSLVATGPVLWPLLAVSGAVLLSSNSVTVVQGQEFLPANTGIASGLTLGLGFGLSGILASGLTTFSDHAGVATALWLVPVLPLLAAAMAVVTPRPPQRI